MVYTLQRATVEEYDSWKSVFDEHGERRTESGSQGGELFRSTQNQNEVVILLEWDSEENARSFIESDDLRETMQDAGVQSHEVDYLEHVEDIAD